MSVEFADDELDELSARVVADPDPARTSMPAVAPTSSATSALLLGIFTTCPPVSKLTSAEYPGEAADPQAARRPRSRAAREVAPFVLPRCGRSARGRRGRPRGCGPGRSAAPVSPTPCSSPVQEEPRNALRRAGRLATPAPAPPQRLRLILDGGVNLRRRSRLSLDPNRAARCVGTPTRVARTRRCRTATRTR